MGGLEQYAGMMLIPPVLDVFVVWHPDDVLGEEMLSWVSEHFRSTAFSGLAGGAVEVYGRSVGWVSPETAPRDLGINSPLGGLLPAAQFNAIVPVLGVNLARAVRDDDTWATYINEIVQLDQVDHVGVYPLRIPDAEISDSALAAAVGSLQALPEESLASSADLGRELCQAIAQRVEADMGGDARVRVFISHTKHDSLEEADQEGPPLFATVRDVIAQTRLSAFFDAQDLQPGTQWETVLDANASNCALLMVRTDKYAGREWTQREVLAAKLHDVPIVGMYALNAGEERGSFLMDHVPSVACDIRNPKPSILMALNRLVDEALKRALWSAQTLYLREDGFDWTPVHSPEPVTLAPWLAIHKRDNPNDEHVWIIHPDPPLGPKERDVIVELCELAGFTDNVDVLTPRTFAARGGRIKS